MFGKFDEIFPRGPRMSHPLRYSLCMRITQPAATTPTFFDPDNLMTGYYVGKVAKQSMATPGQEEDPLLRLCREIAGALIRCYLSAPNAALVREEICQGLMEQLKCDRLRAQRLIELAMELIHVHCYGEYQRDPLELGLLISRAEGHVRDVTRN